MAETAVLARDEDTPLTGIAFLVCGLTLFSGQDVIIKTLSAAYPAHEIVFLRGLVAMGPILLIIYFKGGLRLFRTRRPIMMILRGLMGYASYMTYYLALSALPLADVVTLFYSSPLFVTALSVPFLGEKVGGRRLLAVLVGFLGVLVITRPGARDIDPAMLLAVAAALCYSVSIIITRKVSRTESGSTLSFYAMLTFVVASGLTGLAIGDGRFAGAAHPSAEFLLRAWALPTERDFVLIAICGLIAGAGFYCLSQAYSVASASVVAPFEYSSLPWAILWGYVFWSELPGPWTVAGVALVVGSGLYIIHREGVRGRRVVRGWTLRQRH